MPPSGPPARAPTFVGRLLVWQAVTLLVVLGGLAVVLERVSERHLLDELTDSLVEQARTVEALLPREGDLQEQVVRLGRAVEARITLIRTDGVVLADSRRDPATMENHRNRPEVRAALAGRVGVASRTSTTVGVSFRYVALPPKEGRIVRLALPLSSVRRELNAVRVVLVVGFGLAAAAGLGALALGARTVSAPLRTITRSVARMARGESDHPLPEGGPRELAALAATVNRMREEVTARIEALGRERALRDAILSSLEEGVVLFDRAGEVSYLNRRTEELLGRPLRHARELPPRLRDVVELRGDGSPRAAEAGSSGRTLEAAAVSLPGDLVLLVLRDVTQARLADTVRREFVANASHELKTPVASIRALAETIGSALEDPPAVRGFLAQLEREAVRLSRIVSDLLDLSRLESEIGPRVEVRFDRLVADEVERHRERARDAGLALGLEVAGPATVTGSPADLTLLVRNLVDNAIRYTPPGGRVDVRVVPEDGAVRLEVRDTGIGIPRRDQARIFERFYRVDRARSRETGGTGLGLSIVKHVAENHDGTVGVESELGRGSTFTVRLPASAGAGPPGGQPLRLPSAAG